MNFAMCDFEIDVVQRANTAELLSYAEKLDERWIFVVLGWRGHELGLRSAPRAPGMDRVDRTGLVDSSCCAHDVQIVHSVHQN